MSYTVKAFVKTPGSDLYNVLLDTFTIPGQAYLYFGSEGVWWALVFIVTLAAVGVASQNLVVPIVIMLAGLVGVTIIGLVFISYATMLSLIILGGIIIWRLGR